MAPPFVKRIARKLPGIGRIIQQRDELSDLLTAHRRELAYEHGNYYSAIPSKQDIDQRYRELESHCISKTPGVDLRLGTQKQWCERIASHYHDHPFPNEKSSGSRYHFDNETFLQSDAIILYGMLRELKPRRIVEVGSGFSSAVMLDTNEKFLDNSINLTFIEPYPELLQSLLSSGDQSACQIIQQRVQDVDSSLWSTLKEGDFLFIDSSHVSKCGSDVNHLFFDVIPRLDPGVVVHVHDVYPHFEYPRKWLDDRRFWNEDYLLRAFLQFNSEFEVLLWAPLMLETERAFFEKEMPICLKNHGGSFWMRRK